MSAHDPFIRLNKLFTEQGSHRSTPLFIRPEDVKEIKNGRVHLANGFHDVSEKAEEIKKLVIEKLDENHKNEIMGKE